MNSRNLWSSSKFLIVLALTSAMVLPFHSRSIAQSKDAIPTILKNRTVGEKVTLIGKILKKDRDEGDHSDYILTDGVNKIIIELEDENFQYKPNDTYKISGTVILESDEEYKDKSVPKRVEIQVKSIEKVTKK